MQSLAKIETPVSYFFKWILCPSDVSKWKFEPFSKLTFQICFYLRLWHIHRNKIQYSSNKSHSQCQVFFKILWQSWPNHRKRNLLHRFDFGSGSVKILGWVWSNSGAKGQKRSILAKFWPSKILNAISVGMWLARVNNRNESGWYEIHSVLFWNT